MKISVIMASYNYEKFIIHAIESVIAQDYQEWELIIVDDGSSDNSLARIGKYLSDSRIKLYCHENNCNQGLLKTLKLGLSKCNGNYVAFLESDDIWKKNCLTERVKILERYPNIAVIANDVELFGDEKRISSYDNYFSFQGKTFSKLNFPCNIFTKLLRENFIPTFSCAMVQIEYLRQCNFDVLYSPWLDRYLWLQLAYRRQFYYIDKKLTRWRIHKSSYIGKENNAYKINNNKKIYSLVKTVFCRDKNSLSGHLKTIYYYLLALRNKYFRVIYIFLKNRR
ncbi:MAG: glycosyltransferase [Victivallaceae bacterium]|nr:glycosyltransferase [Victivallaceae bacterium]